MLLLHKQSWLTRSLFLTFLLVVSGCSSLTPKIPGSETIQRGACDPLPCLTLQIQDPIVLPDTVRSEVSSAISNYVCRVLYAPVDTDIEAAVTKQGLIHEVSNRFEEESAAGMRGRETVAWQLTRAAKIVFQSAEFLTIDILNHGYLGGAHGFEERTLVTFDLKDGHKVTLDELISPNSRSVLASVAEVEFRRVRNVPAGQSLQEAGFSFPAGEPFKIPENFGITASGLVLLYNPYDIASFALGATEVTLPREAVEPLLRSDSPLSTRLLTPLDSTLSR